MNKNYITLDILKYIDRGVWYRGFQPFVAKRLSIEGNTSEEEYVFVQVFDDLSFVNQDGEEKFVDSFDYLDITNLDSISCVSKEEFEQNFEVISKNEEMRCQMCVKLRKNY